MSDILKFPEFSHTPVLLKESIEALQVMPQGVYIDCTVGGGGHSLEIAGKLDFSKRTLRANPNPKRTSGALLCLDQDRQAIEAAKIKLANFPVILINDNFTNIKKHASEQGFTDADGILMDLGVSSHQLDSAERGFSFHEDAPLDMRMNPAEGNLSAYDVVNTYSAEDLTRILFHYGEEKFARGITSGIIKAREESPVKTTNQLAEIIKNNVPLKIRKEKNPCRKTFQAIRIEVNSELENIEKALPEAFELLKSGGRLAVISFHSLEDRIVKNSFKQLSTGCICPPEFPVCVCGNKPKGRLVYKKPVTAGQAELENNIRSRSAKLRVIEKI
ncbi:MAG: 16S rRNA (cytosine(1402)-N(4))-methyltransferase RsmH [Oscillospiraceae bacterium]|nr:16S rRNA (cytosine(1402)-N(4))-methyltransferase RsmH [Oscillospiraceae bacterium]